MPGHTSGALPFTPYQARQPYSELPGPPTLRPGLPRGYLSQGSAPCPPLYLQVGEVGPGTGA